MPEKPKIKKAQFGSADKKGSVVPNKSAKKPSSGVKTVAKPTSNSKAKAAKPVIKQGGVAPRVKKPMVTSKVKK